MNILFILKRNESYGTRSKASGLFNSAEFVNTMLRKAGIESNLVEVVDNNDIDREVTKYKPDIVIIEALWVVPEKFEILHNLHPNVRWVVRLHSHVPFIANEGIAVSWLKQYAKQEYVSIATNYKEMLSVLRLYAKNSIYLPNYYPVEPYSSKLNPDNGILDIGCFGAIRPLKNQLIQAIAALQYANYTKQTLYFHINSTRIENSGDSVLKNIRHLFERTKHVLVEHEWYSHQDFLNIVAKMDLGLQVSLSETYNIVTADFINMQIPVVVSKEIEFVNKNAKCNSRSIHSILQSIDFALDYPKYNTFINKRLLKINSEKAKRVWLKMFS